MAQRDGNRRSPSPADGSRLTNLNLPFTSLDIFEPSEVGIEDPPCEASSIEEDPFGNSQVQGDAQNLDNPGSPDSQTTPRTGRSTTPPVNPRPMKRRVNFGSEDDIPSIPGYIYQDGRITFEFREEDAHQFIEADSVRIRDLDPELDELATRYVGELGADLFASRLRTNHTISIITDPAAAWRDGITASSRDFINRLVAQVKFAPQDEENLNVIFERASMTNLPVDVPIQLLLQEFTKRKGIHETRADIWRQIQQRVHDEHDIQEPLTRFHDEACLWPPNDRVRLVELDQLSLVSSIYEDEGGILEHDWISQTRTREQWTTHFKRERDYVLDWIAGKYNLYSRTMPEVKRFLEEGVAIAENRLWDVDAEGVMHKVTEAGPDQDVREAVLLLLAHMISYVSTVRREYIKRRQWDVTHPILTDIPEKAFSDVEFGRIMRIWDINRTFLSTLAEKSKKFEDTFGYRIAAGESWSRLVEDLPTSPDSYIRKLELKEIAYIESLSLDLFFWLDFLRRAATSGYSRGNLRQFFTHRLRNHLRELRSTQNWKRITAWLQLRGALKRASDAEEEFKYLSSNPDDKEKGWLFITDATTGYTRADFINLGPSVASPYIEYQTHALMIWRFTLLIDELKRYFADLERSLPENELGRRVYETARFYDPIRRREEGKFTTTIDATVQIFDYIIRLFNPNEPVTFDLEEILEQKNWIVLENQCIPLIQQWNASNPQPHFDRMIVRLQSSITDFKNWEKSEAIYKAVEGRWNPALFETNTMAEWITVNLPSNRSWTVPYTEAYQALHDLLEIRPDPSVVKTLKENDESRNVETLKRERIGEPRWPMKSITGFELYFGDQQLSSIFPSARIASP